MSKIHPASTGAEELPDAPVINAASDVGAEVIEQNLLAIIPAGAVTLTLIHPVRGIGQSKTFVMPEQAPGAAEWAAARNLAGNNVYFGVNASRAADARSKEADITYARFGWADIDPDIARWGDYRTARDKLEADVLPLVEPVASILIDSGNGYQGLFRFAEPLALGRDEDLARYKEINAALGHKFMGAGTHNADRILRLPGTLNYPNQAKLRKGYPAEPRLSNLLLARDVSYSPQELRELSGVSKPVASAVQELTVDGVLGKRFANFLASNPKAAARYNGDRNGLNDQTGSSMDMSLYAMMKRAGFTRHDISVLLDQWPHGSQNGRSQGARYWDRLDERTEETPLLFARPAGPQGTARPRAISMQGITAEELSRKEFPPLNWVIPGILPEGCYLLTARPKVGKSWLALQISLAVALGLVTLGQQAVHGKAVYLALEDNQRRLKDRLKQLRPQGYASPNLILHTEWPKFDAGGLVAIRDVIERVQPKLIVIDTLAKVRPQSGGSNVYESDYAALAPLTEIASKHRCCIVVIHHNRKGKSDSDALEQISGSLGLVGAVDGALVIDGVRSDKQYKLSLIGRDIPTDDELAIARQPNGEWLVLGAAQQVFISAERKQITDLLVFHPEGLKPKGIADLLGKGQSATRKLLMSMTLDQQVKVAHGVYSLPAPTGNSSSRSSGGNTGNGGNSGNA